MLRVRGATASTASGRGAPTSPGCPYACFLPAADLEGATVELVAPATGRSRRLPRGARWPTGGGVALTNTCAANALGIVEPGDYAYGDRAAALAAFDLAGAALRLPAEEVARRMLQASTQAVGDLVAAVDRTITTSRDPSLVAVGGGAGRAGPRRGQRAWGSSSSCPEGRGDQRRRRRAVAGAGRAGAHVRSAVAGRRRATGRRGRGGGTRGRRVSVEHRRAGRASAGTQRGAGRRHRRRRAELRRSARAGNRPRRPKRTRPRRPAASSGRRRSVSTGSPASKAGDDEWLALDRYGDVAVEVDGVVLRLPSTDPAAAEATIAAALQENVKRVGPVSISPDAWVICGSRFLQVPQPDSSNVFETVRAVSAGPIDQTVVIIGRE